MSRNKNDSERLSRTGIYRIKDALPAKVAKRAREMGIADPRNIGTAPNIMAKWDGQPPRCPKKGEMYLSGSSIDAYVAKQDMTTPYHIAQPVTVDRDSRTWIKTPIVC